MKKMDFLFRTVLSGRGFKKTARQHFNPPPPCKNVNMKVGVMKNYCSMCVEATMEKAMYRNF